MGTKLSHNKVQALQTCLPNKSFYQNSTYTKDSALLHRTQGARILFIQILPSPSPQLNPPVRDLCVSHNQIPELFTESVISLWHTIGFISSPQKLSVTLNNRLSLKIPLPCIPQIKLTADYNIGLNNIPVLSRCWPDYYQRQPLYFFIYQTASIIFSKAIMIIFKLSSIFLFVFEYFSIVSLQIFTKAS